MEQSFLKGYVIGTTASLPKSIRNSSIGVLLVIKQNYGSHARRFDTLSGEYGIFPGLKVSYPTGISICGNYFVDTASRSLTRNMPAESDKQSYGAPSGIYSSPGTDVSYQSGGILL